MIITEIELQFEDIRWFGIDTNHHVFTCTSAGIANVPTFVCNSKENTLYLEKFFLSYTHKFSEIKFMKSMNKNSAMYKETINLTSKGIYCYDAFDLRDRIPYCKISEPFCPLFFDVLPDEIKEILINNKLDIDVTIDSFILVENAY